VLYKFTIIIIITNQISSSICVIYCFYSTFMSTFYRACNICEDVIID